MEMRSSLEARLSGDYHGINMKELLFPRFTNSFKKSHLLSIPRSVFQLTLLKS